MTQSTVDTTTKRQILYWLRHDHSDAAVERLARWMRRNLHVGIRDSRAIIREALAAGDACPHPPARLYSWTAADDTFCICCCDCGAVLDGAA